MCIYTKHVFKSETAHKRDRCEKMNLYESVKLIGVAGDVDFRRVDCGGGFDLAAVGDVFRAKVDRHIGGGDEHIQHISDHSSDHQRINRSCHQSTERDKEREMEREGERFSFLKNRCFVLRMSELGWTSCDLYRIFFFNNKN